MLKYIWIFDVQRARANIDWISNRRDNVRYRFESEPVCVRAFIACAGVFYDEHNDRMIIINKIEYRHKKL